MSEWLFFLSPGTGGPIAMLMWLISRPMALLQATLAHFLWHDHQKAEYYADYLATTLVGTKAMIKSLNKVSFGPQIHRFLLENVYSTEQSGRVIFEKQREFFNAIPQRERDRVARANTKELSRLDNTHPPTSFRVRFLLAHQIDKPLYHLSDEGWKCTDREMESIAEQIGDRLISNFLGETRGG
ncbi:MAG: hypothetical protein GY927_23045 [bacterium]|nr:hypothetical protein [bacterium]